MRAGIYMHTHIAAGGGRSTLRVYTETGGTTQSTMSPFGQNAASAIRDSREKERKDLQDLNDRLASYIEKVRVLLEVKLFNMLSLR